MRAKNGMVQKQCFIGHKYGWLTRGAPSNCMDGCIMEGEPAVSRPLPIVKPWLKKPVVLCLCFCAVVYAWAQFPDEVFVTTNGAGTGSSWVNALSNIQTAVNTANAGGTVWVSNGVWKLESVIWVTNGITVRGFHGTNTPALATVIDGSSTTRVFNLTNGILHGLVITNGRDNRIAAVYADNGIVRDSIIAWNDCSIISNGGAIVSLNNNGRILNCNIFSNDFPDTSTNVTGSALYIDNASLASNCTVFANANSRGVSMYNNSTLIVVRVSNHDNVHGAGAGIYFGAGGLIDGCIVETNSTAADCTIQYMGGAGVHMAAHANGGTIRNSIIRGNTARFAATTSRAHGGLGIGINFSSYLGAFIVSNCWILDNTMVVGVNGSGGGIGVGRLNSLEITHSVISGNVSRVHGGGVFFAAALTVPPKIRNCLIVSNTAEAVQSGGGVFVNIPMTIESCTIANNSGGYGGLRIAGTPPASNQMIINNIIFGNNPANLNHLNTNAVYFNNCTAPLSAIPETGGTGNTEADPLFVGGGNYRLQDLSPCINAGTNRNWMAGAKDLRGYSRLDYFHQRVDIGCYEHISRGTMIGVR